MATENVVLLAFAVSLGVLQFAGGPLSGLIRSPPKKNGASLVPTPPPLPRDLVEMEPRSSVEMGDPVRRRTS